MRELYIINLIRQRAAWQARGARAVLWVLAASRDRLPPPYARAKVPPLAAAEPLPHALPPQKNGVRDAVVR